MQDSREFSQLKQKKSNSSNEIPCLHCVLLLVVELSTDNCTYMRNYRNISCNIYQLMCSLFRVHRTYLMAIRGVEFTNEGAQN